MNAEKWNIVWSIQHSSLLTFFQEYNINTIQLTDKDAVNLHVTRKD